MHSLRIGEGEAMTALKSEMKKNHSDTMKIFKLLCEFFKYDENKVMAWLFTKNHNFGGSAPAQVILAGRAHKVLSFIESTKEDHSNIFKGES